MADPVDVSPTPGSPAPARHFYNEADNMSWRVLPDGKVQFWTHVHGMWVDDTEGYTLAGFETDPDVHEVAPRYEDTRQDRASVSHNTDEVDTPVERIADEIYETWKVTANRDAYVGWAIRRAAAEGAAISSAATTGAPMSGKADASRPVEIMAGYLVVPVEGCTCDGGGEFPHRPECGYEPAVPLAEVEAAIARARRAEGHPPTSGVTNDMVEAALQAVVALGCGDRDDPCDPGCSCREIDDKDRADFQLFVRTALSAALAGYTVVRLPAPDANKSYEGDPIWTDRAGNFVFAYHDADAGPIVDLSDGERIGPGEAEETAAILLAAAREARRLAAGSQVGDEEPAPWRCDSCGSDRWVGWRAGPAHEGFPRKAQCVPCGAVQELPQAGSQVGDHR